MRLQTVRARTLLCFFFGADTLKKKKKEGRDEFRIMHIEAQLAQAGMKKGNDWRAGCYKLDYSSHTHTHQDSLSLHTHTHQRSEDFFPMCCFLPASFAWGYFECLVFALSQVWLKRCNRISPNHHTKDNEKGAHLKKIK